MASRALIFCVVVFSLFVAVSADDDKWERDRITGAWRDNYNRTVYICANFKPHAHNVYFTVSPPGAPTNTTYFGFGNYSQTDDEGRVVKGKVFWFNKTDDGLQKDNFRLEWRGKDDTEEEADYNNRTFVGTFVKDQRWILVKRLYKREPSPSICWKPEVWQLSSRVPGRWQRSISNGDYVTVNICPAHGDRLNQQGQWQWSFKGTGGKFRSTQFENANMTMWAIGYQSNSTGNYTGHAFVQSGLTILTEIVFDPNGRFLERVFYTYVGAVDVVACNLPTGIYFPIPYARLSLLTYPGIAVAALIMFAVRDYVVNKRRLSQRLVG
eukprot:TRINITY_DN9285_c0_g1_i1.p1 TRINITY_DN9285_c0_g1~~TRINITY_DN9285_c0_g1_i1.p1  ORF type:complete len:324 (-),score=52.44 TRINITY_DN9285_c0_g1_i1:722-1693(-)